MGKKWVIGFFVLCLAILGTWVTGLSPYGYDPISHYSCSKKGDVYKVTGGGAPVIRNFYACVHTYNDGGKSCNYSDECEGACMAVNGSGICQKTSVDGAGNCRYGDKGHPGMFCP